MNPNLKMTFNGRSDRFCTQLPRWSNSERQELFFASFRGRPIIKSAATYTNKLPYAQIIFTLLRQILVFRVRNLKMMQAAFDFLFIFHKTFVVLLQLFLPWQYTTELDFDLFLQALLLFFVNLSIKDGFSIRLNSIRPPWSVTRRRTTTGHSERANPRPASLYPVAQSSTPNKPTLTISLRCAFSIWFCWWVSFRFSSK